MIMLRPPNAGLTIIMMAKITPIIPKIKGLAMIGLKLSEVQGKSYTHKGTE